MFKYWALIILVKLEHLVRKMPPHVMAVLAHVQARRRELGTVKYLQHKTPTSGKVSCAEGITLPFEARKHRFVRYADLFVTNRFDHVRHHIYCVALRNKTCKIINQIGLEICRGRFATTALGGKAAEAAKAMEQEILLGILPRSFCC